MKILPQRTCMGCNEKKNKSELIRIVKNKDNDIIVDETRKAEGRGAYICKNEKCLNNVIKSKRLEKVLECKINQEIYNKLRGVIIDKQ